MFRPKVVLCDLTFTEHYVLSLSLMFLLLSPPHFVVTLLIGPETIKNL